MWKLFPLALLLLFAGCGSVDPKLAGHTMPQACNPLEDRPFVIGWVDGQSVRLAVDTGAAQETLLFSSAVEALGGRLRGRGDMQTTNLDVMVYQGQPQSDTRQPVAVAPQTNFQGLIGWPMIRQFVWNINYPKKEHKFTDAVPFFARQGESLKILPKGEIAYLVDRQGRRIALDTGAPYGIYLGKRHWEQWKAENPYAFITLYDGFSPAAGGNYIKECSRCSLFAIGNIKFHNIVIGESFIDPKVMGLDHDIDIIVGLQSLKSREVWIDGKNNEAYFGSESETARRRLPLNLVGACFSLRSEGRVSYEMVVQEGSIAWDSGVRTGDRLVSLSGVKYPDYSLIQYVTHHPGASATLVVSRHGRIRRFNWVVPTEAQVTPQPPIPHEEETEFNDLPVVVDDPNAIEKNTAVPVPLKDGASVAPSISMEPGLVPRMSESPHSAS